MKKPCGIILTAPHAGCKLNADGHKKHMCDYGAADFSKGLSSELRKLGWNTCTLVNRRQRTLIDMNRREARRLRTGRTLMLC